MGALSTHGTRRQLIRSVPSELERELRSYHRAHAALTTALVRRMLEVHGRAYLIDLHSYGSRPPPSELHAGDERPPLCVGYEERSLDAATREAVRPSFDWLPQADNATFKGSHVPLEFYRSEPRVCCIMLEIRREQYLDEAKRPGASRARTGACGGADGNRTRAVCLGSRSSAIELQPRAPGGAWQA